MRKLLRIRPVFHEKIWGGRTLADSYGYPIPSDRTGECWGISAHPHGDCVVENPEFEGMTLSRLFATRPELFGDYPEFPLLVKIIDAREDLSIQVHPDDAYARSHENGSLGKAECWYVLDCQPDAQIIIGHHARTRQELAELVRTEQWDRLLRRIPVHKGDCFRIDPGCVHGIRGGTVILETQQSSDVTYRIYDYGRLENGKPRTLHLDKSLDVTTVPFVPVQPPHRTRSVGDAEITCLMQGTCFSEYRGVLRGQTVLPLPPGFVNLSILEGSGTVDGEPVTKGCHRIFTAGYGETVLRGNMEFFFSFV